MQQGIAALDWVALALLALSVLVGAWRGLVFEVLSLLGWVAAFVAAQWLAADVAARLPMEGASEGLRWAVAFVLVFVLAAFAAGLLAALMQKLVKAGGLRPVDRTLGALFGLLRAGVLLLALAAVVMTTPLRQAPWWRQSVSGQWLEGGLLAVRPLLPPSFAQHLPEA